MPDVRVRPDLDLRQGIGQARTVRQRHVILDEDDMTPFYAELLRLREVVKEVIIDNGDKFITRTIDQCLQMAYEDMSDEAVKAGKELPDDLHSGPAKVKFSRGETPVICHLDELAFWAPGEGPSPGLS